MDAEKGRLTEKLSVLAVLPREAEAALSAAPVPIVVTDATGSIRFHNSASKDLLGRHTADLTGRPLLAVVQPADGGLVGRRIAAVVRGEPSGESDLVARVEGAGRARPCLIGGAVVQNDRFGRLVLWVLLRTGTWRSQPRSSDATDIARALSRLTLCPRAGVPPHTWLGQAARWCREVTGKGSEVNLFVDAGGQVLLGSTSPAAQRWTQAQLDAGQGPVIVACAENKVVGVSDLGGRLRFPALARTIPAGHDAISCPVVADGSVLGALSVYDGDAELFEADDLVLRSLAAATAAIASELTVVGSPFIA